MDDGHLHLLPFVTALVAAGNSIEPHPATSEPFRPSQGGYYCPLTEPIDFTAVQDIPRNAKVHFVEDEDYIWCEHCWSAIFGGRHRAKSYVDYLSATGRDS
jgi:hypothetical protein